MRIQLHVTIIAFIFCNKALAADCGIAPEGSSFGAHCELVRESGKASAPQKSSPAPAAVAPQKKGELVQLGAYSGKSGYFVNSGTQFQLHLEALIMNEVTLLKIQKLLQSQKLGEARECFVSGLQQGNQFTIFDLQGCR